MAPQETTRLLAEDDDDEPISTSPEPMGIFSSQFSFADSDTVKQRASKKQCRRLVFVLAVAAIVTVVALALSAGSLRNATAHTLLFRRHIGPYKLLERQEGSDFFQFYDFFAGQDSIGSAGYITYIDKKRSLAQGLANVTTEQSRDIFSNKTSSRSTTDQDFVYMQSKPTDNNKGPRDSVRLEGKRRFDRGLFIIDLRHMPAGCGVWPAFWLVDEAKWPNNGEIDIVEGINDQLTAKTALHTSESCSMYAHVSDFNKTGTWDSATGIPDSFTGKLDFDTAVPADNCWVNAPHQWQNQGCVAVSESNTTLGTPLNAQGGGVYALEWDPENGYIRSWVFSPHGTVPSNLRDAMQTASSQTDRVVPDPAEWGLPYAFFAIGDRTGCSSDHFKNMRIVFNLALCGQVAGNRFMRDCPALAAKHNVSNDAIKTCNAYIASNPAALEEAYWKVRGVYVYEREYGRAS